MPTSQKGPIAVYGATGFTGSLVAHELRRRGAEFVLAGRNQAKLDALAEKVGGAETRAVSVDDAAGLRDLLDGSAAVIACAGPFMRNGEPIARAAAETGTHYVDTTGEQPFMRLVFDTHGAAAERNGACLVTAMGFDYVPGDMIASLTADGMGELEDLTLAYGVHGMQATRGTTLSALDMVSGGDLDYRNGSLVAADRSIGRGTFTFPGRAGEQRMTRYPAGEPITVPRHVDTRNVTMLLNATAIAPKRVAPLLGVTMPAFGVAMRVPALRNGAGKLVARLPEGPDDATREANTFTIVCDATAIGGQKRRGVIEGRDVYGLTAVTTVEAAMRMADPSFDRSGALAPSEAFEPTSFLDSLAPAGIEYEVEGSSAAVPA